MEEDDDEDEEEEEENADGNPQLQTNAACFNTQQLWNEMTAPGFLLYKSESSFKYDALSTSDSFLRRIPFSSDPKDRSHPGPVDDAILFLSSILSYSMRVLLCSLSLSPLPALVDLTAILHFPPDSTRIWPSADGINPQSL